MIHDNNYIGTFYQGIYTTNTTQYYWILLYILQKYTKYTNQANNLLVLNTAALSKYLQQSVSQNMAFS